MSQNSTTKLFTRQADSLCFPFTSLLISYSLPSSFPGQSHPLPPPAGGVGFGQGGQTRISCPPQVVNYSPDTMYASFHLKCSDGKVFDRLRQAKIDLQGGVGSEVAFEFGKNGHFTWSLQRSGSRFYPYVMKMGDIIMSLSSRSWESNIPNCTLHFGSLTCNTSIEKEYKSWRNFMGWFGFDIVSEKVGRVDICCDIIGDFNELDLVNNRRRICRSTNVMYFESNYKYTGIQIGKGDVICRIYRKDHEMLVKKASEKIRFFSEIWNIPIGTPVVRVEFQIRREAIKEIFGREACTIIEVLRSLDPAWEYLTLEWLRLTEGDVDRENKNQSRSKESVFWMVVQDAVDVDLHLFRSKKIKHINIESLKKQARGIMVSIAAALGHCCDDFFGILSTVTMIISDEVSDYMMLDEFQLKFKQKQALAVIDL